MAEIKTLLDEYGVIHEANKILPSDDLKIKFLASLAELEDNTAHKTGNFPRTRLHKVTGVKQKISCGCGQNIRLAYSCSISEWATSIKGYH